MRRIVAVVLLFSIMICISSCTDAIVGRDTEDRSSTDLSYDIKVYHEDFGDHGPDGGYVIKYGGLGYKLPEAVSYDEKITVENINPNVMNIALFDKVYTGTYTETIRSNRYQHPIHRYEVSIEGRLQHFDVDTNTGEIVQMIDLPYDIDLQTEAQYLEAIQSIVGDRYDISEYNVRCESVKNNGGGIVQGFIEHTENVQIENYYFYFTKTINGLTIRDSFSVYFLVGDKMIRFYVTDFRDTDAPYYHILTQIDDFDKIIEDHVKENFRDDLAITEFGVSRSEFFLYKGEMFVNVDAYARYVYHESDLPADARPKYIGLSIIVKIKTE